VLRVLPDHALVYEEDRTRSASDVADEEFLPLDDDTTDTDEVIDGEEVTDEAD